MFRDIYIYIPHNVAEETRRQQLEEEKRREEERKREEEERKQQEYENGEEDFSEETESQWFSSEAYRDKDVLKKEYRVLVSKYHPDNNPSPEALKKFLSIQKEREEILARLEN